MTQTSVNEHKNRSYLKDWSDSIDVKGHTKSSFEEESQPTDWITREYKDTTDPIEQRRRKVIREVLSNESIATAYVTIQEEFDIGTIFRRSEVDCILEKNNDTRNILRQLRRAGLLDQTFVETDEGLEAAFRLVQVQKKYMALIEKLV